MPERLVDIRSGRIAAGVASRRGRRTTPHRPRADCRDSISALVDHRLLTHAADVFRNGVIVGALALPGR